MQAKSLVLRLVPEHQGFSTRDRQRRPPSEVDSRDHDEVNLFVVFEPSRLVFPTPIGTARLISSGTAGAALLHLATPGVVLKY